LPKKRRRRKPFRVGVAPAPEFQLYAAFLATVAAALFGAALVTTHSGLRHVDAAAGARVSIPTATVLLWLIFPWAELSGWHLTAAAVFGLVGVFFPAAVTLLTFEANRRLGPTVTAAIGSTAPLFAVLGAVLFLAEPLGGRTLGATALIVLGVAALTRTPGPRVIERPRGGLWLAWSAALLRALAQVLSKAGLALWPSAYAAALVGYTVSSAAVWCTALRGARSGVFNRAGIAWFAVTGTLNGAAVLCLYSALNHGPVSLVSPIAATYPLFTFMLSALFLRGERLTVGLIAGVTLTVAGVAVLVAR
jgi:drug/metabolite transporter (DMT)-like permease